MISDFRLNEKELRRSYGLEYLDFETTKDLEPLKGIIGQQRGVEALEFGLKMKKKGYNIYVSGRSGTGRTSFTKSLANEYANKQDIPDDWVYVYNFIKKDTPLALRFSPGLGKEFKDEIENMIKSFRKSIGEVFDGNEYKTRSTEIVKMINLKKNEIMKLLNEKAKDYGFRYGPTEQGLASIPLKEDAPMSEEEYQNLTVEEMQDLMEKYNELHLETMDEMNQLRHAEEELEKKVKELNKTMVSDSIEYEMSKLLDKYEDNGKVIKYLNGVKEDILNNIDKFRESEASQAQNFSQLFSMQKGSDDFFNRYRVNLFIDNSELDQAPLILESNPVYNNLAGHIEYKSQMGALTTDFMQIKPGALHLANGGYLIFQMKEILSKPASWELIKRALLTNEINMDNQNRIMGSAITSSLQPESIPLDIKVIIIGDEYTYSMLYAYDDDFGKLFKIRASFDVEMDSSEDNGERLVGFIAKHCARDDLRHLDKEAVISLVEYSTRLSGHQEKFSTRFNKIVDLLHEADVWADIDASEIVKRKHVEMALEKKKYRSNMYEEKLNDMFLEGSILIDFKGKKVGQINALAVIGTGEYAFGKPSRITASVFAGEDGVINIEREAKQSGNLHDKGVYILSGYLGQRYGRYKSMGLSIGIGFEQNYSMIDGDSASSTELYAILSSMSEIPLKQNIAVTGSVNQKGQIQPIGGVNEKIEGFYEICKLNGLTGDQGVLIPRKNIMNLMLNKDVIESVEKGEFHIYAIETIEEGIEILTDKSMEEIDEEVMKHLDKIEDESEKE